MTKNNIYLTPSVSVIYFESTDVITTSNNARDALTEFKLGMGSQLNEFDY